MRTHGIAFINSSLETAKMNCLYCNFVSPAVFTVTQTFNALNFVHTSGWGHAQRHYIIRVANVVRTRGIAIFNPIHETASMNYLYCNFVSKTILTVM